ncbi:MAG: hypothetical protein F4181_00860, partial [Proteobacteria bacterium]|nr:hypothetical protein [Pseudomonadota bacterium]
MRAAICISVLVSLAACTQDRPGNDAGLAGPQVPAGTDVCASGDGRLLHVPSPDWRDQVIYMLMTDRFDDGDPTNNDQGYGEYAHSQPSHFSGGDF